MLTENSYRCRGLVITKCDVSDGCEVVEVCRKACTDYNSPPDGGVPGDECSEPPAEVSKRDELDASLSYDNHDGHFYTCTAGNDIEECNESLVAACTVKEHCPLGCFQRPDGAACVDRAAPPAQVIKRDDLPASLAYDNYGNFYFVCNIDGGIIEKCSKKLGASRCIIQERCRSGYCSKNDNGAWCRNGPALDTQVSKRDELNHTAAAYDNVGVIYYICAKNNVLLRCSRYWGLVHCNVQQDCGKQLCFENDKGAWCRDRSAASTEVSKRDEPNSPAISYDNFGIYHFVCDPYNSIRICKVDGITTCWPIVDCEHQRCYRSTLR